MAATETAWKCEGCGWTNLGYVPECDGCGESRETALMTRAQLIESRRHWKDVVAPGVGASLLRPLPERSDP